MLQTIVDTGLPTFDPITGNKTYPAKYCQYVTRSGGDCYDVWYWNHGSIQLLVREKVSHKRGRARRRLFFVCFCCCCCCWWWWQPAVRVPPSFCGVVRPLVCLLGAPAPVVCNSSFLPVPLTRWRPSHWFHARQVGIVVLPTPYSDPGYQGCYAPYLMGWHGGLRMRGLSIAQILEIIRGSFIIHTRAYNAKKPMHPDSNFARLCRAPVPAHFPGSHAPKIPSRTPRCQLLRQLPHLARFREKKDRTLTLTPWWSGLFLGRLLQTSWSGPAR